MSQFCFFFNVWVYITQFKVHVTGLFQLLCTQQPCCYLVIKWVRVFETLWTVACQAPLSMGSSRQEYWSGLLLPTPKDLPNPGIEPVPPALAGGFFTTEPSGKFTVSVITTQIPHVT